MKLVGLALAALMFSASAVRVPRLVVQLVDPGQPVQLETEDLRVQEDDRAEHLILTWRDGHMSLRRER